MNEEGSQSVDRLEILEAASTLINLKKRCDQRNQWRVRSNMYFHQQLMNPFYNQWPFYKPYTYDVASGLSMNHMQPYNLSYMMGPRAWHPTMQPWLDPLRTSDNTAPLASPLPSPATADDISMESCDDTTDQDDTEDSQGDQEEFKPFTSEKRRRRNLTKKQQEILEKAYSNTKYPHIEERLQLSKATQLTEDRIQIWFQNRRAKDRKNSELLKSPSAHSYLTRAEQNRGVCVKIVQSSKHLTEPSPKRLKQEEE